jgi:RNA polymerase sigma factor (sigma-70 family)
MATRPVLPGADDTVLLSRFIAGRDDTAFAALVSRYGPMVLRVCRRILGDFQEAEDAFQAAFLILARKAATVRPPRMLPAWLHGVAYRVAQKARSARGRRPRTGEALPQSLCDPRVSPLDELSARELLSILDDEVRRLPALYRLPVILCCLEGHTQEEAARRLGWTTGSVKGRLERGRARLHERLVRRGLTLAAALGAAEVSQVGAAGLPSGLAKVTIRAATAFVEASGVISGQVPMRAAALAETVLQSLGMTKLRTVALLLCLTGVLAGGVSLAGRQAAVEQAPQAVSEPPPGPVAGPGAKQTRTDRFGDPLPAGGVDRLGTLRFRHDGDARSVVFSPDGKILAAMTYGGRIILWNARTGQALHYIQGMQAEITTDRLIDFSPDGRLLAGLQGAYQIGFWETATAKLRRTVDLPQPNFPGPKLTDIHTVRFSPDCKFLVVAGDNHCYLVEQSSGQLIHQFAEFTGGVAFSPDGQSLIAQVMNLSAGTNELVTRDVRTVEVIRRQEIPPGPGHKPGRVEEITAAIAFSPDRQTMATGGGTRILLWDAATGKLRTSIGVKRGYVMNLAFTPDGRSLVLGGESDALVQVWDPVTGKEQRHFDSRMHTLRSLALSPDGKTVAVGGVYNTVRLWDPATGKERLADQPGHDAEVASVAYSPDGTRLASGGANRQVWIWDPATGQPVHALRGQSVRQVTFSPDGRYLATLSPGKYYTSSKVIQIYDTSTWQELRRLPSGDANVNALAFTPDSRTLISADWQRAGRTRKEVVCNLNVWEVTSGRRLHRFSSEGIRPEGLAVSPDGRTVVVAGCSAATSVRLWDLVDGEELLAFRAGQLILAVALSPDGRIIVTGGADQMVRLWEAATGREIVAFQGGGGDVAAVASSPDGRFVAATRGFGMRRGNDTPQRSRGIRLWDVVTGDEIRSLGGDDSIVTSLAFSPDGSRLASGLQNSAVLLWEVPPTPPLTRPKGQSSGPKDLDALWADLAGGDARKARAAIWSLVANPEKAVTLLKGHLRAASALDVERVRGLVADLDSAQYGVRQSAADQLQNLREDEATRRVFRQVLADKPSLEVRRRLEELVAGANALRPGEVLRGVRAVEILERINTPEAQQVLHALTKGAPERRLTQEAKAALERLAGRSSVSP